MPQKKKEPLPTIVLHQKELDYEESPPKQNELLRSVRKYNKVKIFLETGFFYFIFWAILLLTFVGIPTILVYLTWKGSK